MFGNDFFGRRQDHQHEEQLVDEARPSGPEPEDEPFDNNKQSCFQNSNWNGLSPRNKYNQLHYKRVREQPLPDYESEAWPDSDLESAAPLVRKRHGSPQPANDYPSKRPQGQLERNELVTPRRQESPHPARNTSFQDLRLPSRGSQQFEPSNHSLGHCSRTEFQLPPPYETDIKSTSWLGPQLRDGESWGRGQAGATGQMFPSTVQQQLAVRQQQRFKGHDHEDPIFISGGNNTNLRRGQSIRPDTFKNSQYRQRGIAAVRDGLQGYQAPPTIDLVTPESVISRKSGAQTSADSGSSRLRRATETDLTDWDSDLQDYINPSRRAYGPTSGINSNRLGMSDPDIRTQSMVHEYVTGYPSQRRQLFNDGNDGNNPVLSRDSFFRQSFNASSTSYGYNVHERSPFGQTRSTGDSHTRNAPLRSFSRQAAPPSLHRAQDQNTQRRIDIKNDTDYSEIEDDTIENMMRKKVWSKKAKDAANASSRDVVSKPFHFGGRRRSVSGYSSREFDGISKNQRMRQKSKLSIAPLPEVVPMTPKQSNPFDLSTPSVNGDRDRYVFIKQTAAQKAEALVKEKAELRRQKLAEETITQRQKRAQALRGIDDLFEEVPLDEDALARIKKSKEIEKARKYAGEEAKIVGENDKNCLVQLAASRKKRAAEELEEKRAEKKRRVEGERQLDKQRDEERLQAKRQVAEVILRRKRVVEEEARLEGLEKIVAEREAAKKRAATLQSFKKTDSKTDSARDAAQFKQQELPHDSGNRSDGGLFISDDVSPPENEGPMQQPVVPADKEVVEQPICVQKPETAADDADVSLTGAAVVTENRVTIEQDEHSTTINAGAQKPEIVAEQTIAALTAVAPDTQKAKANADKLDDQLSAAPSSARNLEAVLEDADAVLTVVVPGVKEPAIVADKPIDQSTVVLPSIQNSEAVVESGKDLWITAVSSVKKPEIAVDAREDASNTAVPNARQIRVPATSINRVSISEVASDGRRRPPEISRPRVVRRNSPDPIRFTGGSRTNSKDTRIAERAIHTFRSHTRKVSQNQIADQGESRTQLMLQKALKEIEELKANTMVENEMKRKEWDALMKQLSGILAPHDREDIANGHKRATSRPNHMVGPYLSETLSLSKGGQPPSSVTHSKRLSLTSQINFVSQVESQERVKQKAEEDKLAKHEKDKASYKKRYEREIRSVLIGQGIEPDDDKIAKQVAERIVAWEENRHKKERRESGGKDAFASPSQLDEPSTAGVEQDPTSPPIFQGTDDEGSKDPEVQKLQEREQATRAKVEFLKSQNNMSNDFAKAASKFRIEDFESDESEEDPDDEPEATTAPVTGPPSGNSEEMVGVEINETLNPTSFDASIIPSLPEVPEPSVAKSKTAFLPDIVNPPEEDMMHSYVVRHRAERGDNAYDSVVLNSFHDLEQANAFARQKLFEFDLGPSTGKSETHDNDNLYLGKVITDKIQNCSEIVWVTREIVYLGDVANLQRSDLKAIIQPKVFNVVQVIRDEDGKHTGSVIATASLKALANKKAADHFLALSKPGRPKIEWLTFFNDDLAPAVRKKLQEAEAKDDTVHFDGHNPETERGFTVSVWENLVAGPLN